MCFRRLIRAALSWLYGDEILTRQNLSQFLKASQRKEEDPQFATQADLHDVYEEVDGAYAIANDAVGGLQDLEKRLTKVIGEIPPLEAEYEEEGDQDDEGDLTTEEEDATDHDVEDEQ